MTCEVCSAPPLPLNGVCVFCHSPLAAGADTTGLLDYLAERLPQARRRRTLFRGRQVRDLTIDAAGVVYRGRLGRSGIELQPVLEPARWAHALLAALSGRAAADSELRSAISRSGWALR